MNSYILTKEAEKDLDRIHEFGVFKFGMQQADKYYELLFENFEKNGMMEGYTDNYLRISTPFRNEWANQIIDWKIQ